MAPTRTHASSNAGLVSRTGRVSHQTQDRPWCPLIVGLRTRSSGNLVGVDASGGGIRWSAPDILWPSAARASIWSDRVLSGVTSLSGEREGCDDSVGGVDLTEAWEDRP
jgi:hypothetical protein